MGQSREKPPEQTSQHGFPILPLLLKQNGPPPCLVSAVSETRLLLDTQRGCSHAFLPSLQLLPWPLPSIPVSFKPFLINFTSLG